MGYHLQKDNITKLSGCSCLAVFKLIFLLVFQYPNWVRAFMSKKAAHLPSKDTVYHFLNTCTYNWRQFLLSLSSEMVRLIKPLTSEQHVTAFIIDESIYSRNRNQRSEWLAILSTDTTLDNEEIVRVYSMRWDIEVFFKCNKSLLNFEKEFQGRSYDALISHTTIVFTHYILITWQMRKEADSKTFGNLLYELGEDIKDINFVTALQSPIDLFQTLAEAKVVLRMDIFKSQMTKWLADLPSYFKQCLDISGCES